jgi:hypothetical protein
MEDILKKNEDAEYNIPLAAMVVYNIFEIKNRMIYIENAYISFRYINR